MGMSLENKVKLKLPKNNFYKKHVCKRLFLFEKNQKDLDHSWLEIHFESLILALTVVFFEYMCLFLAKYLAIQDQESFSC